MSEKIHPIFLELSRKTHDWLIYAEAKNSAVLVANSFAIYKVFSMFDSLGALEVSLFFLGLGALLSSLLMNLWAMYPIFDYLPPDSKLLAPFSGCFSSDNPFSSQNLAAYDAKDLIRYVRRDSEMSEFDFQELDFARYLIGSARMIVRKYVYFKYSILFLVLGVVVFVLLRGLALFYFI